MTVIDRSSLVFFDASCLIAAAASPTGGAGLIWSYRAQGRLRAAVSVTVIEEAARNLRLKFSDDARSRFESMIADVDPATSMIDRRYILPPIYEGINNKDESVVAEAISLGSQFLLTLDRPLIREISTANLAIIALTPEEMLRVHISSHAEYPFD